jgi:hypothetical protein
MMKLFFLSLLLFLIIACEDSASINSVKRNDGVTYEPELTIDNRDTLRFKNTRKQEFFLQFSDSKNSIAQVSGDTLKLFLNTGWYEGSYSFDVQILPDTVHRKFRLFDNHTQYNYIPSAYAITLNKKDYKPGEYIVAQIYYKTSGKHHKLDTYDTAFVNGKVKLKVRDSLFTFEDLRIENERNEFNALLKQRPDTMKKLNLYGCALTDLPGEIDLFTNLEELDLSGNDLSRSDLEKLRQFKHLKLLDLTDCQLSQFRHQY